MQQDLPNRSSPNSLLQRQLVTAFRRAGWRVDRQPRELGRASPDLIIRRGDSLYAVKLKSAGEARRDRLIPLLAQAILEAKAAASRSPIPGTRPLAIIAAPRVSASISDDLRAFAAKVAPEVPIGIVDLQGSRVFTGRELESLSARSTSTRESIFLRPVKPSVNLFSDLNQWILKVLLAPKISAKLIHGPRAEIRNVSELARAARVSLMTAFRCVRLLKAEGYLDERPDILRLVRVAELLHRWQAVSVRPAKELRMRWLIPGDPESQLQEAVREYVQGHHSPLRTGRASGAQFTRSRPRLCLALFAAAEALEFGVVRGVAPHLYLERIDPLALEHLGLVPAVSGQRVDIFIRIPPFPRSVFRAAVTSNGLPVSDIVQVWLDVSNHPSRGPAQAQEIWRRALAPIA